MLINEWFDIGTVICQRAVVSKYIYQQEWGT